MLPVIVIDMIYTYDHAFDDKHKYNRKIQIKKIIILVNILIKCFVFLSFFNTHFDKILLDW